jgi:hypothetical protein
MMQNNTTMKPLNQNKMKELKEMAYYINVTRPDQLVQIKAIQRNKLWYEVIRQHDKNTITEFCCSQERFKNLYIEKR